MSISRLQSNDCHLLLCTGNTDHELDASGLCRAAFDPTNDAEHGPTASVPRSLGNRWT
jgi:hypothetical protein